MTKEYEGLSDSYNTSYFVNSTNNKKIMDNIVGNSIFSQEEMEEKEFAINTQIVFYLANEHQSEEDITLEKLIILRERLESILPKYIQSSSKFHPLSWQYSRSKYKAWRQNQELINNDKSSVFSIYYFMSDDRASAYRLYESLNEEEMDSFEESLQKEGESQWIRWAYSSYVFWEDCPLVYKTHGEDFEFFFAWQLFLLDLFKIKDFLEWHVKNTFNGNLKEFKNFIDILYIKYDMILTRDKNKKVVFSYFDMMEANQQSPSAATLYELANIDLNTPKKKIKEKIEIPYPPKRNKEKWTILSKDDTIKLFDYLIQLECLINDTKKVSKESVAKAIYALTGFSDNDTAGNFIFETKKLKTAKAKEIIVENIKDLIMRNI